MGQGWGQQQLMWKGPRQQALRGLAAVSGRLLRVGLEKVVWSWPACKHEAAQLLAGGARTPNAGMHAW